MHIILILEQWNKINQLVYGISSIRLLVSHLKSFGEICEKSCSEVTPFLLI